MDITYRFDPFAPLALRQIATANDAIELLRTGHLQFLDLSRRLQQAALGPGGSEEALVIPTSPLARGLSLVSGAATPQQPFAIVLSCSDSRVPVEDLFQVNANSVFVIRVAGNVIGTECMASIKYALHHFRDSLRLLVVLGHTACGAVTTAVDSYLRLDGIDDIVNDYALRSLVDRLLLAVRLASKAQSGNAATSNQSRRVALVESSSYVNAALTASGIRGVLGLPADGPVKVMYGVYDLRTMQVESLPRLQADGLSAEILAEAPHDSAALRMLAAKVAAVFKNIPDVGSMTDLLLPAIRRAAELE